MQLQKVAILVFRNGFYFFFIFVLGLVFGSFVNVLIWRLPRKISLGGRSFCPKCKAKISWYDNIPILSFFLLRGKCRRCKKKISWRYPAVELAVALAFLLLVVASRSCFLTEIIESSPACDWYATLWMLAYPFYLFLSIIFVAVFAIDLRDKVILDALSILGFLVVVVLIVLFRDDEFFVSMLIGFASATFLLMIHLFTKGRGMGLGDVKFALFAGALLGWPVALVWMLLSFLTGAAVGIILVITGKARLKSQIAFGPFLVASVFVAFVVGRFLISIFYKW